jgi:hypothetical protein
VREELLKMARMLAEQHRRFEEIFRFGLADALTHERGGDVHAVQDVADVVKHSSCDFRHARLSRSLHQLRVRVRELRLRALAFRDLALQRIDLILERVLRLLQRESCASICASIWLNASVKTPTSSWFDPATRTE